MATRAKKDRPEEPPSPRGDPLPPGAQPPPKKPERRARRWSRPAKAPRPPRARRGAATRALTPPLDYVARTRHGPINLIFLAPWVLVYVLCRLGAGSAVETQAAASLQTLLRLLGPRGLFVATLCTCLALCAVVLARVRTARADARVFPWMLVEGMSYGVLLQYAAAALSFVLPVGRWILLSRWAAAEADMRSLGIAVGAGIFEELVFRGVLCFALFRTLRTVIGADRLSAGAIAVVGSALLFAAYHHLGAGAEPWDAARFTFRFHAGVLLGVVFLTRGLGIAAFAHGFYDAIVLLG